MIERHQILIDALSKIAVEVEFAKMFPENSNKDRIGNFYHDADTLHEVARDGLKTYMGSVQMEDDERSFLPGYHEYIIAHEYDIEIGYISITYGIPQILLYVPLNPRYFQTHGITSITHVNESHTIVKIDLL